MAISVICDRCRAAGTAGTGEFSDLLEFEPVPRPNGRVDGWTEEKQRAFISLLATTGSPHRAAVALGKSPAGARRLREAAGSEGFRDAWDRALAVAAQNGTAKTSTAVADAAARQACPLGKPLRERGFDAEDDAPEMSGARKLELIESLFYKWLGKVEQEREARLAGEVVAADFYLRQTTFVEITFDLMCSEFAQDAWAVMSGLRRGGEHITQIAATPMSMILDEKRRELWARMAEPERPEYPPARYLVPKAGFFTASEHQALSEEEKQLPPRDQQQLFQAMHAEQAAAQAEWERRFRR